MIRKKRNASHRRSSCKIACAILLAYSSLSHPSTAPTPPVTHPLPPAGVCYALINGAIGQGVSVCRALWSLRAQAYPGDGRASLVSGSSLVALGSYEQDLI